MSRRRGKLIVLCGIDGSGKTTQENSLVGTLRAHGVPCEGTKQPTDWYRTMPAVREFLDTGRSSVSPDTLALIAAADRMLHLETYVHPRLASGVTLVCNRYVYSSYGYFTVRGVEPAFLTAVNSRVPAPDLGVFLTIPGDEAVRRVAARDGAGAKFEERNAEYLDRVQDEMLAHWPAHFPVVNGCLSREEIAALISDYVVSRVLGSNAPAGAEATGRNDSNGSRSDVLDGPRR
jgi:dTMP kinase